MKKILKILAIILGAVLILLLVTPVIFKGKIESLVKEKVNEQVDARVDWSRLGLSFFRGFPDLSVSLHELSVVGVESFAGDTLAGIRRFELRVNPFSALRKNLVVKTILVDRPLVNAIVLEDGRANWDITSPLPEEEVPEEDSISSGSYPAITLERFYISGGRIYYRDLNSEVDASLEGFSLEIQGDLSKEQAELKLSAGIDRLNARMEGISYLRDADFQMDLLASANMKENSYALKENLIRLNGLALGVEGQVQLPDPGGLELDLKFFTRETSFKTLLSLVPALYLQDFGSIETRGNLELDGTVRGMLKDSLMPDITLNLQVGDGYFTYPDLPGDVSEVQIGLRVDYRGSDMDATRVDLEKFHMLLVGNPFDMTLQLDHPVSDMHVAGKAKGILDFASLREALPAGDMSLEGRLETDLRWDALMSLLEEEHYEEVDLAGSLLIEDVELNTPEIPVPVMLDKVYMLFNPRFVELSIFDMELGSSDLHLQGELKNFIPYIFDGQIVSGRLAVSSSFLNASELLPERADDSLTDDISGDSIVPVPPDSLASPMGVKFPENMDFAMTLNVRRIEYEDIVIEDMKGSMQLTGGVAGLEELTMDLIEGRVHSTGWIDTRGEFAETDIFFDIEDIDITGAYETFVSVEKLVPMAKYVKGRASIDMHFHSLLDNTLSPLFESINASGQAYTEDLRFYRLDEFVPLSDVLKNEKFSEMAPDEVEVSFTVNDGRIVLNPFFMDVFDSRIAVSGSHGLDLTMDYQLDMHIAKSDLGAGANELIQGMSLLAAGAGLKIPQSDYIDVLARLGGNFNHPRITTDLSGNLRSSGNQLKAAVEERVIAEAEKVGEQVREDAGEKAEEIIASAELEAARLLEEARKAGAVLEKEAEAQGDKLMKEAGSNPLKQVAARTAASELVRQAEKQSARLLQEAEQKGEELIQKAREEAGKI